jgi:hypothetical protein
MKRVTLSRLLAILDQYRGTVIVSAVTRTEPRLLAKSRLDGTPTADRWPHGVEKLCLGRFILANRYQENVRAQRRREGHPKPEAFRAGKLWRGHGRRIGRFLARHDGRDRWYIVARPQSDEQGRPVRIWERWIDLATGQDVTGEELEELGRDWLRDAANAAGRQGVRRTIPYRTYHVESIRTVTLAGTVYAVVPDRSAHTPTA